MKTVCRLTFVLLMAFAPMVLHAQWSIINSGLGNVSQVKFYDANTGGAISPTTLLLTTNGGITFDTAFYRAGYAINSSLSFIDATTLAIHRNNLLFTSSDWGVSWDSVILPHNFNNMVFLNDTTVIGKAGTSLLRSNNSGVTWITMLSGLSSTWFSYEFLHPDTGYVHDADSIYLTHNGGITWSSQPSWPGYRILFPSDSTWYGVKSTQDSLFIIKTTDQGANWAFSLQAYEPLIYFNSFDFADKETIYLGGYRSFSIPVATCGVIMGTGDGGDTWQWHDRYNCFLEMVTDIHCLNRDTVYALEFHGVIYRTTNGSDYTRRVSHVSATTPLYEPCGTGTLYVALNFPAQDTMVVHFDDMFGTATNGVDFVHIPDSVVFLPGMNIAEIPIVVIDDTIVEGPEFFSVVIHNTLFKDTATFWIHDEVPVPFSYSINPPERIICSQSIQTGFTANLTGGAWPHSVIWHDTSGILSQQNTLPDQPIVPYHRTIYVEITDNSICQPLLDSVQLWYLDSCKVEIQSSLPGPVPAGVPVTYSLVHECPTDGLNNYWWINEQFTHSNTEQITHTWSQTGLNTVSVRVLHPCGNLNSHDTTDVITSVEALASIGNLQVSQTDNASWLLAGEGLPPGNLSLQVYDMGGRLIHQHQLHTDNGVLQHTLTLPHQAQGIYLLHVVSDNEFSFREKIVKR